MYSPHIRLRDPNIVEASKGNRCLLSFNDTCFSHLQHLVVGRSEVNISPKNQYFFTPPKMALHGNPGTPLSLDSIISARSPKKAIFLHIVAIYLHRPQRKCYFYAQSNKKFTKSVLHNIVQCFAYIFMSALCNIFQCFADIFMSVLRVTVPDQYFCTKHLI